MVSLHLHIPQSVLAMNTLDKQLLQVSAIQLSSYIKETLPHKINTGIKPLDSVVKGKATRLSLLEFCFQTLNYLLKTFTLKTTSNSH